MTLTGTPSSFARYGAKRRIVRSDPPPVPNGTTSWTGPVGNAAAFATLPAVVNVAAPATAPAPARNFLRPNTVLRLSAVGLTLLII